MFINYNVNTGLSINTFRKPNASSNEDVGGLIDDMNAERNGCCPLEGTKDVLEDGSYWNGSTVTQEQLEELHALICEYEQRQEA